MECAIQCTCQTGRWHYHQGRDPSAERVANQPFEEPHVVFNLEMMLNTGFKNSIQGFQLEGRLIKRYSEPVILGRIDNI
jgi:hypothetical protein